MRDVIVGIDLGTTNSEVAALIDGKIVVIDLDGEQIMPSCVGLAGDGSLLVGTPARNQLVVAPERTVRSIKRKMGSTETVTLGSREFSPQEISAVILSELKRRAELRLGVPVRRAVITVPAFFSDSQRQATRDAGEIAGLEVVRILNEPTAAALAYGAGRDGARTLLVFDLGGGTFDVSIVEVDQDITEVLSSHGDNHLGGDDFDELLVAHVLARTKSRDDVEIGGDLRTRSRILRACEEAKKNLSSDTWARIREDHIAERKGVPFHLDMELSRDELETLMHPLVSRALDSVQRALGDAGRKHEHIDQILLVGGATRTPLISRVLEETTGIEPRQELHPDLCVAYGAAVLAARIEGHEIDRVLVDVTPYSFGPSYLGLLDGALSSHCYRPIIHRNTPLPVSMSESYFTASHEQEVCEVNIYQGDDPNALNDILVGRFEIRGLAPVPEGNEIVCRMELDLDGILRVTAIERATGLSKQVVIERATSKLTEDEIREARSRMAELFGDGELNDEGVDHFEGDLDGDFDDDEFDEDLEIEPAGLNEQEARDVSGRDRRVAITEARALVDRFEKLRGRMSELDRLDADRFASSLRDAIDVTDVGRIRELSAELADLLFFVEEG